MRKSIVGNKYQNHIWILIGVGAAAYLICMLTLFNISGISMVKFLLLNIVSILLPGFSILSLMDISLSRVGAFCTSYLLGYAFLVVEYFFSEIFNRRVSFTVVTALVAVVSGLYIGKKIKNKESIIKIKETDNEKSELLLLAGFVILNVFAYAANYLGTDVVPVHNACRDMQYWVNNTVALKLSWPAENLFMVGKPLYYHYFSNIPIAFLCEVYQIDVFTMSFPLYGLTKAIVVVGAVQFLLDAVVADKRVKFIGYMLMIFSTGAETISVVTFAHHILLQPFGFDISYAYGIFFVGFMIRQWKTERYDWKNHAGMLLSWIMCVGAKAPVASVLIIFAALLCFYWLIHKKWSIAFGYGISILGSFLLICTFCVGMLSVFKGDLAWSVTSYGADHFNYMGNAESWDTIGRCMVLVGRKRPLLGLLFRTICLNPVLVFGMTLTVIWIIYLAVKKRIRSKDLYFLASLGLTAIWGGFLWHHTNAGGASEMYFAMAAQIAASVMIIYSMDLYQQQHNKIKYAEWKTIKKGVFVISVMLLALGVFRFSWSAYSGAGAIKNANDGFWNLYDAAHGYDYSQFVLSGIRETDVKALSWIRDYGEQDALIMTDKAVITDNDAYYLYGIFCERQQYLEGSDMMGRRRQNINEEIARRKAIITGVYNNEIDALKAAKEEGVDYIVQTVDITPGFEYNANYLELVTSTETMNIFRVK